jgi:UDP-glucose 4-epimerase
MRVAVTGASGNVGTAVLRALHDDGAVDEIVAVARRPPSSESRDGVTWVARDVRDPGLGDDLAGIDVVVHLAWLIQPSRRPSVTWDVNVRGTANLLRVARAAGVRAVVHASSVGAYSPRPPERFVDEDWPTHGVVTSNYSREKSYVERLLDAYGAEHPEIRIVRLRPAFIFQSEAASGIRRLFLGSLFPNMLVRGGEVPLAAIISEMRFQVVHADDVADAYRRAVLDDDAEGAFNIAAEPVFDRGSLAEALGAPVLPVPYRVARPIANLAWALRLHPVEPGWVDLARNIPLLRTARATRLLGWEPARTGVEALRELLDGIARGRGAATPALRPESEASRVREILRTRQGERQH